MNTVAACGYPVDMETSLLQPGLEDGEIRDGYAEAFPELLWCEPLMMGRLGRILLIGKQLRECCFLVLGTASAQAIDQSAGHRLTRTLAALLPVPRLGTESARTYPSPVMSRNLG